MGRGSLNFTYCNGCSINPSIFCGHWNIFCDASSLFEGQRSSLLNDSIHPCELQHCWQLLIDKRVVRELFPSISNRRFFDMRMNPWFDGLACNKRSGRGFGTIVLARSMCWQKHTGLGVHYLMWRLFWFNLQRWSALRDATHRYYASYKTLYEVIESWHFRRCKNNVVAIFQFFRHAS